MNKYQEAYNIIFDELISMPELNDIDKKRLFDSMDLLQELVNLHEKIKKDVEFFNSQDIQVFILPDEKVILGYNITDCPSRIVLAESSRKNIENILKCLNRSLEND